MRKKCLYLLRGTYCCVARKNKTKILIENFEAQSRRYTNAPHFYSPSSTLDSELSLLLRLPLPLSLAFSVLHTLCLSYIRDIPSLALPSLCISPAFSALHSRCLSLPVSLPHSCTPARMAATRRSPVAASARALVACERATVAGNTPAPEDEAPWANTKDERAAAAWRRKVRSENEEKLSGMGWSGSQCGSK